MPALSAASPIEIEALADAGGLPAPARAAALALFHDLTSREELAALALPDPAPGRPGSGQAGSGQAGAGHHDGAEWPAHRFLFGEAADLAPVLDRLRGMPDAAELGGADAPEGRMPGTLFVVGSQGGFTGVLLACADADRLADLAAELERPRG